MGGTHEMRRLILAGAAVLAAVCSADAASLPDRTKSPIPPILPQGSPAYHWTSYYFGVHGGHVWGDTDFVAMPSGGASLSPAGLVNFDSKGWLAGFQTGYRHQLDKRFVAGWEADVSHLGADGGSSYGNETFGAAVGKDLEWMGTVRARIGYSFNRFLPYATGGIAVAGAKTYANDVPGTGDSASDRTTATGWVAGVGAEYALTDYLTWKAEYLRAEFGKSMHLMQYPSADGTLTAADKTAVDSLKFGLNLKFQ